MPPELTDALVQRVLLETAQAVLLSISSTQFKTWAVSKSVPGTSRRSRYSTPQDWGMAIGEHSLRPGMGRIMRTSTFRRCRVANSKLLWASSAAVSRARALVAHL